eukprot:GILI01011765.1.p1 GENE.GILI01011765.1~~GILI01011765.1.p1  ORF type:complete len:708 (-),score=161.20 GILI01011765.1:58-2181(-)
MSLRLVTERANHQALKVALAALDVGAANFSVSLSANASPTLEGLQRPIFSCNEAVKYLLKNPPTIEEESLLEWEEVHFSAAVRSLYTQRVLNDNVMNAFKELQGKLPTVVQSSASKIVFWCAVLPALCQDGLLPDSSLSEIPDVVAWFNAYRDEKENSIADACASLGVQEMSDFLRVRRNYRMTAPQEKPFYVTTPIYYVNASPHIGHVYSTLIADAVARYHHVKGEQVFFMTGTDEHGQKVAQAAEKMGKTPKEFTDDVSATFKKCFEEMRLKYDYFIRTTDETHESNVKELWALLEKKGDIYLGKYEGWYCISDETFLTEQNVTDGVDKEGKPCKVSLESGHPCTWVVEENYMFRLSRFQEPILKWLKTNPRSVVPDFRRREVIRFVEGGLIDLSISRKKASCSWGIPIPGSDDHVMYVWLDALSNYYTASRVVDGKLVDPATTGRWPADLHVLGKDILKFHAVYWPAFLMAADLDLPKSLVVHGWWTKDKQKISKSLGNVFDPVEKAQTFGHDALKYFLLRESSFNDDGDYSDKNMVSRLNSELADTFGNLAMRCVAPKINVDGMWPVCGTLEDKDQAIIAQINGLAGIVDHYMLIPDIQRALISIFDVLRALNLYVTETAPWKLVTEDKTRLGTVLYVIMEGVRICTTLLQPVLCDTCPRLLDQLNVPEDLRRGPHAFEFGKMKSGTPLGKSPAEVWFAKIQN